MGCHDGGGGEWTSSKSCSVTDFGIGGVEIALSSETVNQVIRQTVKRRTD